MGDNTDQEFKDFLSKNKIDFQSLEGTKDATLLNASQQRNLNILKTRLDSYPYTSYDQYRLKADILGRMSEIVHENCFDVCGDKTDLPFLSVQEGLCFRNCVTKFSVFYPTLSENLQAAEFRHNDQVFQQEQQKQNPNLKKFVTDPWVMDPTKLLESASPKPAFH